MEIEQLNLKLSVKRKDVACYATVFGVNNSFYFKKKIT